MISGVRVIENGIGEPITMLHICMSSLQTIKKTITAKSKNDIYHRDPSPLGPVKNKNIPCIVLKQLMLQADLRSFKKRFSSGQSSIPKRLSTCTPAGTCNVTSKIKNESREYQKEKNRKTYVPQDNIHERILQL